MTKRWGKCALPTPLAGEMKTPPLQPVAKISDWRRRKILVVIPEDERREASCSFPGTHSGRDRPRETVEGVPTAALPAVWLLASALRSGSCTAASPPLEPASGMTRRRRRAPLPPPDGEVGE